MINTQIATLTKQLKIKDDAIQKAYLIIEAQQKEILNLQQSQQLSIKKQTNTHNLSKSIHNFNFQSQIQNYKQEITNFLEYEKMIEYFFNNQLKEQQFLISNQKLTQLDFELEYWQNLYQETIKTLEKAIKINNTIEQQNLELQQYLEQIVFENKLARQYIQQLTKTENNSSQQVDVLDFISSSSIQALNQSFQTFSSFISEVVLCATTKFKLKQQEETYQISDLKKEIKQLQSVSLQYEIFFEEIANILGIQQDQQSFLQHQGQIIKEIKSLKFQTLTQRESNKENEMNNCNISQNVQKLSTLINQFNNVFNQIVSKFQEDQKLNEILSQIHNLINLLFNEITDSKLVNVKLLNGLNSSCRQLRNSYQKMVV
ncbi:unnamed protein product [Paramecium primaurelia]|uniref:Uncharacterized protein n=1 Tax=Paramecium primaurelia TaxID=5886 RepID=A0A8S1LPT2_PARPR|nr:unnamed protein product [Paramecium primaurelia]